MLTGPKIEQEIAAGRISIDPYRPEWVGPNSIDLHVASDLVTYRGQGILDLHTDDPTDSVSMSVKGYVLHPGVLYLAHTVETIASNHYCADVAGRSSCGRKGLTVHSTAGFIDQGWSGTITLELSVIHPLRIYPKDRLCQIRFYVTDGEPRLYKGRYLDQDKPVESRYHFDFLKNKE